MFEVFNLPAASVVARRRITCLFAATLILSAATAEAQIFTDDFETGYLSAWSSVFGAEPVTAYRITDLDLRDPHLHIDAIFCVDFTDEELPFGQGPSFNDSIAMAITTDEDEDGFLDSSSLLLFRPLDETATAERIDFASGACTAPLADTSCVPAAPPAAFSYQTAATGVCLETVPGSTSAYMPSIAEPTATCFGTEPRDLTLMLNGLEIILRDARIGSTLIGTGPPSALNPGLLMGFLSESDANATTLPAELPVVGGQPLSILLPGGAGNCAINDDRDMYQGESGWWFYLNFVAEPVAYEE